jgi:putative ABC transport system permease protein
VGVVAGLLALLFTSALLKILVTWIAKLLPVEYGAIVFDVTPDLGIFLFVFAISISAGMFSGFVPAMESSRTALSSGVRSSTASTRSRRLQNILVAAQVALSLLLMIAGTIATQSSIKSLAMDPGYDSNRVINIDLQFPEGSKYPASRRLAFVRELRRLLAGLPGVEAVTGGRAPGAGFITAGTAVDVPTAEKGARSLLRYVYVQSNYFETVGIPLILGQRFRSNDQAEHSVIMTEAAAKELWEGQNPIGRSLRLGVTDERFHNQAELLATGDAYQVIGVVRNTRGLEFNGSDSKSVYLVLPEDRLHGYPILIRTMSDAPQVIKAIDQTISSIDPNVTASSFSLRDTLRVSPVFLTSSIAAAISSAIGMVGLLLALMGIYGTVRYIVVLRTREVGIRMAVGAQRRDVLRLILGESARPVLAGLVGGILLSIAVSYPVRGLLYGLNGVDGVSVGGVSLLFLAIALLAAYPPARRAMQVDPMVALRYE